MKKNLVLLGMAAILTALPFSARADADDLTRPKTKGQQKTVAAPTTTNHRPERVVYYITSSTVTGSHIPVVVTRYRGHNTYSVPTVSYDQADIATSGALDVGSALVIRDPAIMFGHTR